VATSSIWRGPSDAGDAFVIDDDVAHHDSVQELGVEVGFLESGGEAFSQLSGAFSEECGGMLKLLGVVSISCENGIEVASVVGIKLALNDCRWVHASFLGGRLPGGKRFQRRDARMLRRKVQLRMNTDRHGGEP
jgi:hypothetical protein